MQKATTPKRFYIDHTADDHKVEVRAVSCALAPKRVNPTTDVRQPANEAERLFSTGRLLRSGLLRKR